MEMTLDYVSVCMFCIVCVVGMIWHVLDVRQTSNPDNGNNNGDGGGGGIPSGFVFPPFDPPSGHGLSLDDWLVDRLPREEETVPAHFYELTEN